MIAKVQTHDAKDLFKALSEIEVKHQDRIFNEYVRISEKPVNRDEFEKAIVFGSFIALQVLGREDQLLRTAIWVA